MNNVVVSGNFDDIRSGHIRFLEEAAKFGALHVLLWSDDVACQVTGEVPKFPVAERKYFLETVRYVNKVSVVEDMERVSLPIIDNELPFTWVVMEDEDSSEKRSYCAANGINYHIVTEKTIMQLPDSLVVTNEAQSTKKKVVVTGCFDWLHSGHVRFFEETSEFGELYVVLGHDENVCLLKGEGHPHFPQDERRYMVQSIRFVKQAMISSGHGWMDAEPEIALIKPEIYAVNEDGDIPEKKVFCEDHDLEYVVLKRLPKEGLPQRSSTDLRGF